MTSQAFTPAGFNPTPFDPTPFDTVQADLGPAWEADLPGSTIDHAVIALPSYSVHEQLLAHYADRLPALEQRYLFCLLLLESDARRVVYISSAATPTYLIDYYLGLLPGLDSPSVRERILVVSLGDLGPRSLSAKLLERPDIMNAVRAFIGDHPSLIEAFNVTPLEEEVAVRLAAPIFGAPARLWPLGTKRGSRRLFARAGIAHPPGYELGSLDDCAASIAAMRAARPSLSAVVVKLDDSGAGDGNAVIDLEGLPAPGTPDESAAIGIRLQALPGWYVQTLTEGGIVEERVDGEDFRSPSVQLWATPSGEVEVLSTHDQILGGHQGQVYLGCTFPADPAYAARIAADARKVGELLAAEGVVGRFAIDFVTVRRGRKWDCLAIEINLRKGGTTHPYGTARLLTGGRYDADAARFVMPDGTDRYYMASDNLVHPDWRELPPNVALDAVQSSHIGYNAAARTGVVLHMVTCLPVDGRLGYTAIGTSPEHAAELAESVEHILHNAYAAVRSE